MQKNALTVLLMSWMACCAGSLKAQTNTPTTDHSAAAPSGTTTVLAPAAYTGNPTVNYVRTYVPRQPYTVVTDVTSTSRTVTQVNNSTAYMDGLGRSLQTVDWEASPNQEDIVTPVCYDIQGRTPYKFLAYSYAAGSGAPANDGSFKMNPFGDQSTFYANTYPADQPAYQNEKYYYSHTQLESSPLNRELKEFAAGNSWAGSEGGSAEKAVKMQYLVNNGNDNVETWTITNTPLTYSNNDVTTNIPAATGVYPAGTLEKTVTLDEAGNATVSYTDLQQKVVLKKVQIGAIASDYSGYSGFLCTYYIYDAYEALRFVIQPRAVALLVTAGNWNLTSDMINELCFRYEYDGRRRTTATKVPGAAWEYMIYDKRDRLVFRQDGNMRQNNQWLTFLFDGFDRNVQTGMTTYSGSPSALQAYVTANTGNYAGSSQTVTGNNLNAFPANLTENSDNSASITYEATSSITLAPGFSTPTGAGMIAEIVPPPSQSFTNTSSLEDNPIPSGATYIALIINNYDDYSATSKSYDASNNSALDQGNNAYVDALPAAASVLIKGQITSIKVRVIENPANLAQGSWLETVTFYDDLARTIQVQKDNYKGGIDVSTDLFDYLGKAVCVYMVHNNPLAGVSGMRDKVNTDFDQAERVVQIRQTINDDKTHTRVLVQNTYDAMGQLKTKMTGEKTDNAGNPLAGQYLENDAYAYNIRGWLKGINWNYPTASGPTTSQVSVSGNKWFGMDLSYDWGFQTNQFNGNIAGMRWMGGGDGKERTYGYGYDAANRVLFAQFNQNFSGTWAQADPSDANYTINFTTLVGTGLTASAAYDENGNIKQLQQWGLELNKSVPIDNLQYAYEKSGVSNKLESVTDLTGTASTGLGDFTDGNTTGDDYGYDVNGNLVTDKNKLINGSTGVDLASGAIVYTHLNLAWEVPFQRTDGSSKGTIIYIYDASGVKLEKRVNEPASSFNNNTANVVTTSYLGNFVYQNNVLQYILHSQGRSRPAVNSSGVPDLTTWIYEYFLKDHLGNTRSVLTDQYEQDVYPAATVEASNSASLTTEESYYTINTADIINMSTVPAYSSATNSVYQNNNGNPPYNTNPNSNTTANSSYMYKLNGSTGDKTGLGITLRVMAGDVIDIWAKSYYHVNGTLTNPSSSLLAPAVNALLTSMAGTPGMVSAHTTAGALTGSSVTPPEFQSWLNGMPTPASSPKAFVCWVLFSDQFRPIAAGSGADPVYTSGDYVYTHHQNCSGLQMPSNGYLYVYCSNESNQDVYFDNLQVVDTRSPLVEEDNYYPFGLTMTGISGKAVKTSFPQNKYRYNGKELQNQEFLDGSGLEEYDFAARFQDPQLGVWHGIDPLADKSRRWSPYSYAFDNPIRFIDPDGMEGEDANGDDEGGSCPFNVLYYDFTTNENGLTTATTVPGYSDDNNNSGSSDGNDQSQDQQDPKNAKQPPKKKVYPLFATLLKNYPMPYEHRPDRTPAAGYKAVDDNDGASFLYFNQCSIRMTITLKASGVDVSGVKNITNPGGDVYTADGNVMGAVNLAGFLKSYLGKPVVYDGTTQEAGKLLEGKTGIIFFQSFVETDQNGQNPTRTDQNTHIDLWNKNDLMSSYKNQMLDSKKIWFWEIQ